MDTSMRNLSVTQFVKQTKQPHGGFIPLKCFEEVRFDDGKTLYDEENIHGSLVGMAVDYLSRLGKEGKGAFQISLLGAGIAERCGLKGAGKTAEALLDGITGLDDKSITNACKLVTFDAWKRNPASAVFAKTHAEINPNAETVANIRLLTERVMAFLKEYGPVTAEGFTFEPEDCEENELLTWGAQQQSGIFRRTEFGGYTEIVSSGDGDYLTKNTLWDIKTTKSKPTKDHTLQVLCYYLMGKHSRKSAYEGIRRIGLFNPRHNTAHILEVGSIPAATLRTIETMLGYDRILTPMPVKPENEPERKKDIKNSLDPYDYLLYAAKHGIETADKDVANRPEQIKSERGSKEIVQRAFLAGNLPAYEQEACTMRYYMNEDEIGEYQKRGRHSARRSVIHGLKAIKTELDRRPRGTGNG